MILFLLISHVTLSMSICWSLLRVSSLQPGWWLKASDMPRDTVMMTAMLQITLQILSIPTSSFSAFVPSPSSSSSSSWLSITHNWSFLGGIVIIKEKDDRMILNQDDKHGEAVTNRRWTVGCHPQSCKIIHYDEMWTFTFLLVWMMW